MAMISSCFEHYAASGSGRSASTVITEAQPNDQEQERDVNAQLNPGDADDGNRPAHKRESAPGMDLAPMP